MRKRRVLIGILTITLLVGILILQPPKDDGLDFIRMHGPKQEFLSHLGDFKLGLGGRPVPVAVWDRVFVFDKVPEQLIAGIRTRGSQVMSTHSVGFVKDLYLFPITNGRSGLYYSDRNMIVVTGEPSPSWLAQQWNAIRRRMGADFKTPRSSN